MSHRSEMEDLEEDNISEIEDNDDSSDDGLTPPPPPPGHPDDSEDEDSLVSENNNEDDDDANSLIDSDDEEPRNSSREVGEDVRIHSASDTAIEDYGNDDDDSDDDDDEHYLQKFDSSLKTNIISEYHPELKVHNNEEVEALSKVVRNEQGIIVDPLHRTVPILTKYERARILGERAKQINMGAKPVIPIADSVIDGYLIALEEFNHKKIPFIVKRPLPNGGCEYWKLQDLEVI